MAPKKERAATAQAESEALLPSLQHGKLGEFLAQLAVVRVCMSLLSTTARVLHALLQCRKQTPTHVHTLHVNTQARPHTTAAVTESIKELTRKQLQDVCSALQECLLQAIHLTLNPAEPQTEEEERLITGQLVR